jgi:hypothetical protein
MNNAFERLWKEAGKAQLRYYLTSLLEVLRKSTENSIKANRFPGRDSIPTFPE